MMSFPPSFIAASQFYFQAGGLGCFSATPPVGGHGDSNRALPLRETRPRALVWYKDPLGVSGTPLVPLEVYRCPFEPAFIQKRNQRERQRVKCVNQGYAKLRDHLPGQSATRRLSKVQTLRAAISYIKYLQGLVEDSEEPNPESSEHLNSAGRGPAGGGPEGMEADQL